MFNQGQNFESTGEEKHYEMLWNCPVCGTEKNLGKTHRFCPNCGSSQNPDSRYFPSDDEKVAVEDHHFVGVDLICSVCGTLNSADAHFCGNCGADLETATPASQLEGMSRATSETFESSGPRDIAKEKFDAEMRRIGVQKPKNDVPTISGRRLFLILGIIAVLVIGAFIFFTRTEQQTVTVVEHSWEREIAIEEFAPVGASAWQDQVPGDAYSVSCSRQQRSSRQVPDGQECRVVRVDNGDGTFSERNECRTVYRSEPVYDQMCRYTVDRWTPTNSLTTTGLGLVEAPFWGELDLNCAGIAQFGCQREAGRREAYVVEFRSGDIRYKCTLPESEWTNVPIESVWTIEVRAIDNTSADCSTLQPAN